MQKEIRQSVNRRPAFTLVELILVVGTIGMVTGALVGVIGNSTKDYEYGSDRSTLLQDGQAVLDQMVRTLRQAKAFSAVTASTDQAGYITFTSADDVTEQFKLNTTTGELEYGPPASLSALTGDVSGLTFTCYDTDAVALTEAVEPTDIKSVQIAMTLTSTQNTVTLTARVLWPTDITREIPNPLGLVQDASGNGSDGIVIGATTATEGVFGQAMYFDGTNDRVEFIFPDGDKTIPQYTFALWLKAETLGQAWYSAAFNCRSQISHTADFQMDVNGANPGSYRMYAKGDLVADFGPVTTEWIHLAATCDGITTRLYYNGNFAGNIVMARTHFGQYVLGRNRGTDLYWNGWIDDLQIHTEVLTEDDIGKLMLGGRFGTPAVWWTFDPSFEVVE